MGITFREGQTLSSMPVNSGSLVVNSALISTHQDPRSVRVQAIYWGKTHNGGIVLRDGNGIQFYSGSAVTLTAIHATLPFITVTTPITYTISGVGNAGTRVVLYGEIS